MTTEWNTELNPTAKLHYSNIASAVAGGTVAAVTDFGASLWNSTAVHLGADPVNTYDLLERIDKNALAVYEENPDLIHTASFIGGIFVPAGLALKGMNLARSGMKGTNWFTQAGRKHSLSQLDEIYKRGPDATAQFNKARRQVYAQGVANQTLDAAAMEIAILGTMNAHPYMEDYIKDPVKNAVLYGLLPGAVIGGGLGHIADRFAVKQLTGAAQEAGWKTALAGYDPVFPGIPQVSKLQMRATNLENLEALAAKKDIDPMVKYYAEQMALTERAAQVTEFNDLASKMLKGLNPEDQRVMLERLATDLRFQGIDQTELWKVKASDTSRPLSQQKFGAMKEDFGFDDLFNEKGQITSRVFVPEFGYMGPASEAIEFSRASVLGETPASIMKGHKDIRATLMRPDNDMSFEMYTRRSPDMDRIYLERLAHVNKLDAKKLDGVVIAPDDLPTLNALVARAMKDPDGVANLKIKVTKAEPNYDAISKQVFKQGGVKADHHQKMAEFTNPQAIKQYDMFRSTSVSGAAKELLAGWRSGAKVAEMRTAADAAFRGGFGGRHAGGKLVQELYNSSESTALRAKFREIADAEGNVYLWRGLKQNPRGHATLESYTTDINKAREFGTPKLFKVHVDDILGSIADLKSGDGLMKNEIIVGSPARQVEAGLPVMSKEGKVLDTSALQGTIKEITYADASKMLVELKEQHIQSMAKQGIPPEVIGIRTNTPPDTVKAFLGYDGQKSLLDLLDENLPYMSYRDADRLEEYLSPLNRPMVVRGNVNKVPYAQISAALDTQALDIADREIKASFLSTSTSDIAKDVGRVFFSPERKPLLDMLRMGLSKFNEGFSGFKFLQSADFYVRDFGDAGKIAAVIGKDVQHVGNEAIKRILKPINEAMESAAKTPEALTEANTALAMNAQLKGWREYRDGQFWQKQKVFRDGKQVEELVAATFQGKEFKVIKPEVDLLLKELATAGREMLALKNTGNRIKGVRDVNDLGFWAPAFNPVGKHINYVWNKLDDTTQILWGNTAEELANAVSTYKSAYASKISQGHIQVVNKGEQELFNLLQGRADPFTMEIANVEKLHSGASAPAIVKANVDAFTEITEAYQHYIQASVRSLADMSMSDITGNLMRMSQINQLASKNQPLTLVQKWISGKEDPAAIMRNTLLGVSNINQAPAWQSLNQSFETGVGIGLAKVRDIWNGTMQSLPKAIRNKVSAGEEARLHGLNYEELAKKLEAEGIVNPWQVFDDKAAEIFGVAKLSEAKNVTPRMVFASNALAATMVLRFGEIAQPLVNAISLPILTAGTVAERLPMTFMGAARGTAKVPPAQAMLEGVRAAFSDAPMHVKWAKDWEAAGYFKPLVSEASDVVRLARRFEPGAIAKVEQALDTNLVSIMSSPADYSEAMVRRVAMFTGGNLAKRLYPELSDTGVTIFARDFMDKVVGNYHAAQRPTLFQGTLGTAASLFQTYMLSMAQRTYRHLELKDYKALAKMMLTQQTIFGIGSLPGFGMISEHIGEHFSDNNMDLSTGTFRALPDPIANVVLYGLPSSIGPALYSRGELAPRGPTSLGEMPAVNITGQLVQTIMQVGQAMGSENADIPRAIGQALSMQSISRPLARLSEVATGYSITRQGNTIAVPEEVWTPVGIFSRMMSTRPLAEAKLRDAIHLDRYYGSLDREARMKVTSELKLAIRNGTLTDEKLARYAEEYMRTGSPQGWRAAVNTALIETNTSGRENFANKLKDDNPLMFMINQLDGE